MNPYIYNILNQSFYQQMEVDFWKNSTSICTSTYFWKMESNFFFSLVNKNELSNHLEGSHIYFSLQL